MPFGNWRLRWLRAAVTTAFALWLASFNIFNIGKASEEASANVFLRLIAPMPPINRRLTNEPIVVVLFDKRSLDRLSLTWPLDFAAHASLLNSLASYRPRAIFFDLAFYQHREGEKAFAEAIRKTVGPNAGSRACIDRKPGDLRPGIPVFFAKIPGLPLLDALCQAGAEGVLVGWNSEPNLYPLRACDEFESLAEHGPCNLANRHDTAATRLWRETCSSFQGQQFYACAGSWNFEDNRTFSLTWGVKTNPTYEQRSYYPPCKLANRSWWEQWGRELGFLGQDAVYFGCPATRVVPPDTIMQCDDEDGREPCGRRLRSELQGKVVIVGADLPGLRDRLPSPVHGLLAGAFTHAQALDNLLRYGSNVFTADSDYFEESSVFSSGLDFVLFCLTFLILCLTTFATIWSAERWAGKPSSLARLARHDRKPDRQTLHHALRTLGALIALTCFLIVFPIAATAVLFWGLRAAPINWTKILTATVLSTPDKIFPAILFVAVAFLLYLPVARRVACWFLGSARKEHSDEMEVP